MNISIRKAKNSGQSLATSLTNKVVVITGASSGIGAAAAAAFVQAGTRVALAMPTDVTRAEDCDRLARLTTQQFGRIDVLVNNAGTGHWTRFDELTEAKTRMRNSSDRRLRSVPS